MRTGTDCTVRSHPHQLVILCGLASHAAEDLLQLFAGAEGAADDDGAAGADAGAAAGVDAALSLAGLLSEPPPSLEPDAAGFALP